MYNLSASSTLYTFSLDFSDFILVSDSIKLPVQLNKLPAKVPVFLID